MDKKKLQLKGSGGNMRCKLLQKRFTGKTTDCSKHLRHIASEKNILSELNRCIFQMSLKYINPPPLFPIAPPSWREGACPGNASFTENFAYILSGCSRSTAQTLEQRAECVRSQLCITTLERGQCFYYCK